MRTPWHRTIRSVHKVSKRAAAVWQRAEIAAGLRAMYNTDTDIMQAERDALVDIRDIHIDSAEPVETKIRKYVEQVKNPFLVRYGDYIIKLSYADTEKSMDDRMTEYVDRMAKIQYGTLEDFE